MEVLSMAEILQWLTEAQETLNENGSKCDCLDEQGSCSICHAQRLIELAKMRLEELQFC